MERWILTAVWVTLPVSAGGALTDAVADWSSPTRIVVAVACWAAWAAGLLALVVPHPVGLTALRLVAPAFAVVALVVLVGGGTSAGSAGLALAATLVAAGLAARPAIARVAVNAVAYGDELRFPLRTPLALFLGPLPLVRLLTVAAVVTGPLLLADERWVAGSIALVVGAPVAGLGGRALHGLSTRAVILVPAGVVVLDPFTLSDPVLFVRERIVALRPVDPGATDEAGVLDLRLGALGGGVALDLDREAELFRAVRARRGAAVARATGLRVAVAERTRLLEAAAGRRVRVPGAGQTATPPPSSTSSA